jgi:inner membrane protein
MDISHPILIWFLAGIALFFTELFVPAFVLFFFAVGAWLTAALCWLMPINLNSQLLIFIVASLLSLFGLRRLTRKVFRGDSLAGDKDSALARPGSHAVVVEAIRPPAEGKVKYSGTFWRAIADERIEEGEIVGIISQQGLLMRVQRLDIEDGQRA